MISTRGRLMAQVPPDPPDNPPACGWRTDIEQLQGCAYLAHQLARQVTPGLAQRRLNQIQILAHQGLMQGVQADLPRFPWASGELTAPGSRPA